MEGQWILGTLGWVKNKDHFQSAKAVEIEHAAVVGMGHERMLGWQ